MKAVGKIGRTVAAALAVAVLVCCFSAIGGGLAAGKGPDSPVGDALKRKKTVFLVFFASQIKKSAAMTPEIEAAAGKRGAAVVKFDAGDPRNREITDMYGVTRVPTVVVFERGRGITGFHQGAEAVTRLLEGKRAAVPARVKKTQDAIARNSKAGKITILEFYATWCGSCEEVGKVMKRAETESRGGFVIVRIDMDADRDTPALYNVEAPPDNFVIGVDGAVTARFRTLASPEELEARLAAGKK